MSAKHTPGPWVMRECPKMFAVDTADIGGGPIVHTDIEANARLIAAAPDLLKAAKQALQVFVNQGWDDDLIAASRLKAAIAKATGKEDA